MIDKKLRYYINRSLTLHGETIVICQGDHISAMVLEAVVDEIAYFKAQYNIGAEENPWVEVSLRNVENRCLGMISYVTVWRRLAPDGLLHQLGFLKSRHIDAYQNPVRQLSVDTKAIEAAIEVVRETLKEQDRARWS
jgi:hypothetical protein